jgi:ParB-like chromosome segregation protein Spo0J
MKKELNQSIPLSELKFDEKIYPRQNIDEHHIKQMCNATEGGIVLPPIVVEHKTKRIVDGVHRYHAALRREAKRINCVLKTYANETELFREAVMLNTGVGLKLGVDDTLKVIEIGERLHLKEIDLSAMLRTSIAHLRMISKRFGTLEETVEGVKRLRRIPLKGSIRHLSGEKISAGQMKAIESAPGQSYLLSVRQLLDACRHGLLPPPNNNPVLWGDLQLLRDLIDELLRERAAA